MMQHKVPLSLAAMTEPVNDTGDEEIAADSLGDQKNEIIPKASYQ
jgi:hypothetical protein